MIPSPLAQKLRAQRVGSIQGRGFRVRHAIRYPFLEWKGGKIMNSAPLWAGTALGLVMLAAGPAPAQSASYKERSYWNQPVLAPVRALELTLGTGYAQGFGRLQPSSGGRISDRIGTGIGVELGAGYRLNPRWMIGMSGAYQFYSSDDALKGNSSPGTAAARAHVAYHFDPYARVDPWLGVGTGYRYVRGRRDAADRVAPGLHGVELLSLTAGTDVRVEPELALAPVLGADVVLFLWDDSGALGEPRPSAFIYLGMQGRVDIGRSRSVRRFVARN